MADRRPRFDPGLLDRDHRVACGVEYDGSAYNGWQSQPHPGTRTVQTAIEDALAGVAGRPVRVHCAGRTDTGVHATGQVIHFDPGVARSPKSWVMGGNAALAPDIRLHWAQSVNADFHARFSARSRRYVYAVANTPVRPALMRDHVTWYRYPLDAGLMHAEARCLLGELDFSAFRAAGCQSPSPMRCVHALDVSRRGDLVLLEIEANAFLHHMVRNIAGSLLAVGSGRKPPGWLAALLASRDRRQAADTAPASGLYLVAVDYPDSLGLPRSPGLPAWFGNW